VSLFLSYSVCVFLFLSLTLCSRTLMHVLRNSRAQGCLGYETGPTGPPDRVPAQLPQVPSYFPIKTLMQRLRILQPQER
jgi:hypothetical protein